MTPDERRAYQRKYQSENRERVRGYKRKYRAKNREKINEHRRSVRLTDPEKYRKYGRRHYRKHKDECNNRSNAYYLLLRTSDDPRHIEILEKIKATRKRYYWENHEKIVQKARDKRAKIVPVYENYEYEMQPESPFQIIDLLASLDGSETALCEQFMRGEIDSMPESILSSIRAKLTDT